MLSIIFIVFIVVIIITIIGFIYSNTRERHKVTTHYGGGGLPIFTGIISFIALILLIIVIFYDVKK